MNSGVSLLQSSCEDILAPLRVLEATLREPPVDGPEGQSASGDLQRECLYYLNTYGTHLALISFYTRHDRMTEALTYLLSQVSCGRCLCSCVLLLVKLPFILLLPLMVVQECPEEVFLEGLLQPCLERGRLGALQAMLEKLDPTLEASSRYLMASCQFLQRRRFYNSLYQLQQFMMVRSVSVGNHLLVLSDRGEPSQNVFHVDRIMCEQP